MKRFLSIIAAMIISAVAFAQEKEKPIIKESSEKHPFPEVTSTSIGGANYELISPHDSAVSYRLNKETGEVWYIETDKFIEIPKEKSDNDSTVAGQTNYQIFINRRKLYLMNINTGAVWYKTDKLFSKKDSFVLLTHL